MNVWRAASLPKEPIEYIESWDDGEIPWEFNNGNSDSEGENAMGKRRYLLLEPKRYNFWNEKMDDGDVEWEMNIQMSLKTNSKTFMIKNEKKTDKMMIWEFIDGIQRNENLNECVNHMAKQLVTTENIFTDVLNINNSRADFDVLLTAAVMMINMNMMEQKNNMEEKKQKSPLNMLFMVVAFLLTKGVEPLY